MMNYLNRCLLLGRYGSIAIINDNISCLVVVTNDEDDGTSSDASGSNDATTI